MRRCFCTYFDHNYLPRGLALYGSLKRHCPDFRLWVLCLSDECHQALTQLELPEVIPISMQELEAHDQALRSAKYNRSRIEYYFTCTPSLICYIFQEYDAGDLLTYLDADLFFFASPEPVFAELNEGSVGIIAHRFPKKHKHREQFGIFNVGWISFRHDKAGVACMEWWRSRCIEWCYDRLENDRFADQKYLDQWPCKFENVKILQHKGANVAPWNVDNYKVRSTPGGNIQVDEVPLIFFHFHSFKQIGNLIYAPSLVEYCARPQRALMRMVYTPYHHELLACQEHVSRLLHVSTTRNGIRYETQPLSEPFGFFRRVVRISGAVRRFIRRLMSREYVVVIGGRALC